MFKIIKDRNNNEGKTLNKITDIELQMEYQTLLEEFTWIQDAIYNYTTYVWEHKDTPSEILSPSELIQKRTKVGELIRPVVLEMKQRGLKQ